jgi:hypothetical protein
MFSREFIIGVFCVGATVAAVGTEVLTGNSRAKSRTTDRWSTRDVAYRLAGTTTDKANGKAFSGLTIKVFGENGTSSPPIATTVTDEYGRYGFNIDRRAMPHRLRAREQKFFLQVFNTAGHLIKSTARYIELTPETNARIDIRLLNSEVTEQSSQVLCGFGSENRLSAITPRLSSEELVETFTVFKEGGNAAQLNNAQQTFLQILSQPQETRDCAEGYYSSLKAFLQKRGEQRLLMQFRQLLRPPLDKEFFTKNFHLRFTTSGLSTVDPYVPAVDSRLEMPNGELVGYIRANVADLPGNTYVPPVYVQQVGVIAEHALERFINEPFNLRNPLQTGERMEIIIDRLGAAGAADPDPEANHILIRNRNSLDQNFATVPHELFHFVQYQYNRTADRSALYGIMREGGARFIEDSFNDDYNRYIFESQEIFLDPAQSLLTPPDSCQSKIDYAGSLFWKYIAEQHSKNVTCRDEPHIGIDTYREVLLRTGTASGTTAPYEVPALRTAIKYMSRPGSFDQFQYFGAAQTELDTTETTWGNYLIANYVHALDASPPGERRFRYLEDNEMVTWPFTTPELPTRVAKLSKLSVSVRPENEIVLDRRNTISRTIIGELPYAARYYRITPNKSAPPRSLRVSLNAFGGMNDPLIQILSFGAAGVMTDISKSDQPSYTKTINMTGLSSVVVIVASRMNAGDYTATFEEVEGGADPMITRWNSATRTEYEVNQRDYPWTQSSPDLIIDNNNDNRPDATLVPGINNSLKIRLHNRGNAQAVGVTVRLQYRAEVSQFDPNLWESVRNASNEEQTITGVALAAAGSLGDSNWFTVNWAPLARTSSSKLCVKAMIQFPGDLNADNNISIGCFIQSGSQSTTAARP